MSIVKMSEFQLILLNEHVPSVLEALQLYGNISFKELDVGSNTHFQKQVSRYDFEKNQFMREHIQNVLCSLKKLEKKQKKKNKAPVASPTLTYQELVSRCQHIDIDALLDMFDKYYDAAKEGIDGFEYFRPWNELRMSSKELVFLYQEKPLIGTIETKLAKKFITDLKRSGHTFYMYRPLNEHESIFAVLPGKGMQSKIEILLDKYHFEKRSSKSLEIEKDIVMLQKQLKQLIEKRQTIEARLGSMGNYREELQLYFDYLKNEHLRFENMHYFLVSDTTTRVDGWVFTEEKEKFVQLLETQTDNHFVVDIVDTPIDSVDVPIKLKNNKFFKAFESVTSMYALPRYNEVDPTPLLTPFYAVFFGMMLGDVGYGLLLGLGTSVALKFGNFNESVTNFLRFLLFLSVPTTLIGWVYGSFFGGLVPIKGLIDINKDFMSVLIFSICFGIGHLFIGLAIKAYLFIKWQQPWAVLFDVIFWYMALSGAIVLISQMFTPLLAAYSQVGWVLLLVGMVGIVLTNGREAKTWYGKLASGLYSLYGMTGYVSDVLSYSRLMALGLAGASIGYAFNLIVEMLSGFGVLGIIAGMVVFVIGHTFNMGISGLSAYVHSARLTFVEFFGKFYTGGGKRFNPFRSPTTYITIVQEED